MADKIVVMISSTILDLPQHRAEVKEACLQQGMFPDMMEHLPASPLDAIRVSMEKVDKADLYLGVFGHRYGYVPGDHDISITEMEYERAVNRGISRMIFVMHKDHLISIDDVDFEHRENLQSLKNRLKAVNTINFFKSATDLRGLVVNSLAHYRSKCDEAKLKDAERIVEFFQEHTELSDLMKVSLKTVGPEGLSESDIGGQKE